MKRKAEKDLHAWLEESIDKHLYITGLRGCGKTTLVLDFASVSFKDDYLYLNFETSYDLRTYFENSAINDFSDALKTFCRQPEGIPSGSCIILDELHCCGSAAEIMKKAELIDDLRIIVLDSEDVNTDITDKWQKIRLFPLSFDEFLDAAGKDWYREVVIGHFERMRSVPELVHNELNDLLSDYLVTGGMPGVINRYLEENGKVRNYRFEELQLKEFRNICRTAEECYGTGSGRMLAILNAVAKQMADGSGYFNFSRLRKGTSYHFYENAIEKLCLSGSLIKCTHKNHARLFLPDVGLLAAVLKSGVKCDEKQYADSVIKNYIAQELEAARTHDGSGVHEYWASSGLSYVDHIIVDNGRKYALKYIDRSGKKIRSLNIYNEKYPSDELFAVGDVNFNIMGNVKFIPLYTVFCLFL